mgnify:CR=1 FL=1
MKWALTASIAATSADMAEGDLGVTPFTFTVTRNSKAGTSAVLLAALLMVLLAALPYGPFPISLMPNTAWVLTLLLLPQGRWPVVLALLWLLLTRTRFGTLVRAATQDREMVSALGVNQAWLFTTVFALGALLAGLGGALQLPREPANLEMDLNTIGAAFVVVVVFWALGMVVESPVWLVSYIWLVSSPSPVAVTVSCPKKPLSVPTVAVVVAVLSYTLPATLEPVTVNTRGVMVYVPAVV